MSKAIKICCLILLLLKADISFTQILRPAVTDTERVIQIIKARSIREKRIDSVTSVETLAGDVEVKEGNTLFNCDSAVVNFKLSTVEGFGNVRINQADSLFTNSQYLKYIGKERIAYLKRDVKLTDKKGTLFTQDLEYDLKTGIGKYHNGGKVINGKTILTSKDGTYIEDTRDVYFKNNVEITDPKYKIKADSLIYNMGTQLVTFTGPTFIKSKDATIVTSEGTYDLKTGDAFFGSRSLIKDSSGRTYTANRIAIDDKTGNAQLEGNAIIKDSANGFIATGGIIFIDKQKKTFLASNKPVMIILQDKDSTYIAADTIFSGFTLRQKIQAPPVTKNLAVKKTVGNPLSRKNPLNVSPKQDLPKTESSTDTLKNEQPKGTFLQIDTLKKELVKDTVIQTPILIKDLAKDTLTKTTVVDLNKSDSTVRYFLAFHHVRIFNDSLQSVCDSLYYNEQDSIFRLFKNPVIWSGKNQINGDTIYLFTKNKKAERLYVFETAMIINRTSKGFYNQMAGKTINGYFKDGVIDYMRVKGSKAESVYYVQDDDSAYVGMNRASGDVIDLYFLKQELHKVKFVNDVKGVMHPMKQIPEADKFLKNFNWQDKRRPKNKLELFE